ncbi:energy transducer TonB [Erythrobacter sp. A6_0]|uniref:energy transducer TonB n=1 Tax=Erythrobacter sp. A6_0 TaxID=2821089 RepID=UPI001FD7E72B|nr:energy transducer TonB [Erythrobacter sp. A6_0]
MAPPAPPPAPPPPPPPPSQARSVSPDNAARWAARIQSDYPSSALRRDESGTVTMRITVGANGRVEACSVTGSSGSSALDDAACRGMQRYARYNPALNAAGNPISATTTQSIRYVLPD